MATALFGPAHYDAIAEALRPLALDAEFLAVVLALCELFKRDNPIFNPGRFADYITKEV